MNALSRSVVGIALAAGAVYFFDPVSGHRRRLLLRHDLTRAARRIDNGTWRSRQDLSHRAHHLASRFKSERPSDKALTTGIRNVLKHAISHPKTVAVAVHAGHVILRGDVRAHERDYLLDTVRSVPGVNIVTDHLTTRERAEVMRSANGADGNGWPIASGVLLGATTCGLLIWGVKERQALNSWGQEVWRTCKHQFDEMLTRARQATDTIDARAPGSSAVDVAIDAPEAAFDPGHPGSRRQQNSRTGDASTQAA